MPGVGLQELIIIMVVVMVIFGAGKIPSMMGDLGRTIRELKSTEEDLKAIERETNRDRI